MDIFEKGDDEALDYQINWSTWLGTDTLATSTWTVDAGLTAGFASRSQTTTTQWLSGGTVGRTYTLTNVVTTAAGRAAECSFRVLVVAQRFRS